MRGSHRDGSDLPGGLELPLLGHKLTAPAVAHQMIFFGSKPSLSVDERQRSSTRFDKARPSSW